MIIVAMVGAEVTVGRAVVAARIGRGRGAGAGAVFVEAGGAGMAGTRLPWRVSGVPLTVDIKLSSFDEVRAGAQG
ncbi:hypothetical protein ACQP26_19790 [Micromonospora sp. CA-248089]|uniref:hypothetical protein n=1 Tax=Micromonospora sp. CA-248089 TaxID=3239960 RepID=UPI003D8AE924